MLQTWCKPWHSRNLIHPKLDLWANTSYDYCNAFEVQYGNTNCTCHHTNCTSKLLACGFSIAGALTQELYLEGLPQEQGLYLCCYETEKEIISHFEAILLINNLIVWKFVNFSDSQVCEKSIWANSKPQKWPFWLFWRV